MIPKDDLKDLLPVLSVDLVDKLDQIHPPIQPDQVVELSEKQLAFIAGQRSVVDRLIKLKEFAKTADV